MENENKDLVITGNFNCDLLSINKDTHTKILTDLLDINQLQQYIQIPTRTTLNTKTLIDLMITKVEDTKTINSGVIDLGISDHNLVYICRKVSIPKQPPKIVETRQFKNFNTAFQHDRKHLKRIALLRNQILHGMNRKQFFWRLPIHMHLSKPAELKVLIHHG